MRESIIIVILYQCYCHHSLVVYGNVVLWRTPHLFYLTVPSIVISAL